MASIKVNIDKYFLLNATPVVIGGGIQAVVAFIQASLKDRSENKWIYVLSSQVSDELKKCNIVMDQNITYVFNKSPSKSRVTRKLIKNLINNKNPTAIFTFFGPAYIRFNAPHLCGVADGWVTHSSFLAFSSLSSLLKKIMFLMLFSYKWFWYRRADNWVVEAECARKGLVQRLRLSSEKISIVQNTCGDHYLNFNYDSAIRPDDVVRILTLSSYYPHKNLELIPWVAFELASILGHKKFKFIITIPPDAQGSIKLHEQANKLGVEHCIENTGPVNVIDGPQLYAKCDFVFLPSVLETFSANYPEAMAMKKPIVTTDLDFAHDICGNAALYFRAKDAKSAATCICDLLADKILVEQLVNNGVQRLKSFPDSDKKYSEYVSILNKMIKN